MQKFKQAGFNSPLEM